MRKIFRDLQKEKIREMKEQLEEGEGEGKKRGKEYVGKCLVMVEGVGVGEGEDLVSIKKVEVRCFKYTFFMVTCQHNFPQIYSWGFQFRFVELLKRRSLLLEFVAFRCLLKNWVRFNGLCVNTSPRFALDCGSHKSFLAEMCTSLMLKRCVCRKGRIF